ncbi:hypothetical protein BDB01DRAFT_840392 [Pilobolus umbonatus]|nr:hypothetical protein BDB01DRAFT_840392 [Pilobolus umbonatus]
MKTIDIELITIRGSLIGSTIAAVFFLECLSTLLSNSLFSFKTICPVLPQVAVMTVADSLPIIMKTDCVLYFAINYIYNTTTHTTFILSFILSHQVTTVYDAFLSACTDVFFLLDGWYKKQNIYYNIYSFMNTFTSVRNNVHYLLFLSDTLDNGYYLFLSQNTFPTKLPMI